MSLSFRLIVRFVITCRPITLLPFATYHAARCAAALIRECVSFIRQQHGTGDILAALRQSALFVSVFVYDDRSLAVIISNCT